MASRRPARGVTAALVVLTVTAGLGLAAVPSALAGTTGISAEKVFQSDRYVPRSDTVHSAGTSGYLHAQEGSSGYLWTSYATGATTSLGSLARVDSHAYLGSSSDIVADVVSPTAKVVLRDMAAGTSTDVAITHGAYAATFGSHVLTRARDTDDNRVLWLFGPGSDGTTVEGWPTGITADFTVLGGDSTTAVIGYTLGSKYQLALVDLATAKLTDAVAVSAVPNSVALSADRLVWSSNLTSAHVLNRADLSAADTTLPLPVPGNEQVPGTPRLGFAGDWLVVARSTPLSGPGDYVDKSGERLMAVPLAGGDPVTLLRHANASLLPAPDGGLLAVGGTDSGHWAVRRITATGSRTPALAEVTSVAPLAATIAQLSLQNGNLATSETNGSFLPSYRTRTIDATGTSYVPSAPTERRWSMGEAGPYSTGDGRAVTLSSVPAEPETSVQSINSADEEGFFRTPSASGSVLETSGRYAIVNGASPAKQYIGDLGVYTTLDPILTRSVTAASIWGTRLWTPGTTAGVVTAKDLKTGKTTDTVSTGAPCVPKELQAVGRWIYWSCGATSQAGVYDRTAKKSVSVPSGEALVGDGYLVRNDTAAGALKLTAFAGGTATTRTIGAFSGSSGTRGVKWTVDKFGGPAAYVDADQQIHLVPSGVATQALGAVESETSDNQWEASAATDPWWQLRALLSKPAASWTATVTSKATGAVVRTISGGPVNGNLTARWNLRNTAGALVPNGNYTVTVTAKPADGSGAAMTTSQSVRVSAGAAVRRDFTNSGSWAPDGTGDLLTLSTSGTIAYRPGNGAGGFNGSMSASGWPSTVTLVPFGDLNGDRRNDILVRLSSGELRDYRTMLGQAFLTGTPYKSLGKGWNQYNLLTSPGDVSGDGRPDLIARVATTGVTYLYKGTSTGGLSAKVQIASNWKNYRQLAGVGDFNGDGYGDLLGKDQNNILWRYDGNGKGGFKARVKLASAWGSSYNALIGTGDITGDGKADFVTRDTGGTLWRSTGNGKGSFAGRVKISTGWAGFKGLY
ncbi:FG-GAP-like repeat-containing protein [Streptomyces beijiangensis]|uniref:VCBS repeat-containing protein n=1 Tax=Streptomyces beijiangensis TaxID=163361 RepID=A0A939FBV2_9ACTN|nr:FG-GAP-like repeat-containing protein [Streptomyces beijiangensis]MBO0514587.1 VCBS repeat-containing protein [Streptomyces beijiangensis]